MRGIAQVGDRQVEIEVSRHGDRITLSQEGDQTTLEVLSEFPDFAFLVGRRILNVQVLSKTGDLFDIKVSGKFIQIRFRDVREAMAAAAAHRESSSGDLRAVMPGRVAKVYVKEGDSVRVGDPVLVLEAMKMENELTAPIDGTVTHVAIHPGDSVEMSALLMTFSVPE